MYSIEIDSSGRGTNQTSSKSPDQVIFINKNCNERIYNEMISNFF